MEIPNDLVQAIVSYFGKREEVVIFQTLVREIQSKKPPVEDAGKEDAT